MAGTVRIDRAKLKQLREQRSLSQEGLEQASRQVEGCSVSMATIKRAELGHPLSRRTAARLACFFSVPLDDLLFKDCFSASHTTHVKGLVLWFQTPITQLLGQIVEKVSLLEPCMLQKVDNTLIVAFPYVQQGPCSDILQYALLKLCQPFSQYRALLTVENLIHPTPQQWWMPPHNAQQLSNMADKLPNTAIAVCHTLSGSTNEALRYHHYAPLSHYSILS